MPKLLAFITARPDLSREEFIHYYETRHAPLVHSLLPMIQTYRRNYVTSESSDAGPLVDFDVVTELTFADDAALAAFRERIRQPDVLRAIREDEANFLVSEKTRLVEVLEYENG